MCVLEKLGIDWRKLKQHPISAEYPDITGAPWEQFLVDLKNLGNLTDRKIILAYDETGELKVLDGWQFYRAHLELGMRPEFVDWKERDQNKLYEKVRPLQNNRRHETREAQKFRIEKRHELICRALADGNTQREIAKELGISQTQVRHDINAINKAIEIENGGRDKQGYKLSTPAQFDPDKFKSAIKMALKQIHLAKEGRDGETQVYLDSRYTDLEHLGYDVTERLKKSRKSVASRAVKQERMFDQ